MKGPTYRFRTEEDYLIYRFTSIGPKGSVEKIIMYSETEVTDIFNLGLGDLVEAGDDFDDLAVTNNHDSITVLRTVASTLPLFFQCYPEATVTAVGSNPARTRLYRMGIARHLNEVLEKFTIFGYTRVSGWEIFTPDKDYQAFSIRLK